MSAFSQNWLWAKSATGTGTAKGYSVCADASGNVFVTGSFLSPTITFGSITLLNAGVQNIFLAKFDPNGNVLWAQSAGDTTIDDAYSVSADAGGNVFLTGMFQSPTISFGSITLTNAGLGDIFLAKYDGNGNVLWAKSAGGTFWDSPSSVSADANGNVFVTGSFGSLATFGSTTLTSTNGGTDDIFLAKYDATGNVLWVKSAGGIYADYGSSVSTDANGNVFLTGSFQSPTIIFGSTTINYTNTGNYNVFLAKYDANGNVLWAKSASGTKAGGVGYSASTDVSGNVFVTGMFYSSAITFGPITLINSDPSGNIQDIFIVKYDANGNVLWAKSAGGAGSDIGYSICADANGNVFVTGGFLSPSITFGSITLTPPTANCAFNNCDPMFIVKYDAGSNVLCASALSSGGDYNNSVSIDTYGNAYIIGDFLANPFIINSDTLTFTGIDGDNIFVAKYVCDSIIPIIQSTNNSSSITVPNIFTPNNDGLNDVFIITTKNITTINCKIYNRWGVFVGELTKPNEIWDGRTTSGLQCTTGTYFYVITAIGVEGKEYNEKGFVQLIEK